LCWQIILDRQQILRNVDNYLYSNQSAEVTSRRVIDVGCGTGALLEVLKDYGCTCLGLEYSEAGLKMCRSRGLDVRKFDILIRQFSQVMKQYVIHVDTCVIRRQLLCDIGGFFEGLRYAEDMNLMLRVADKARRILYRPDPTATYRLPQGNSISLAETRMQQRIQSLLASEHARYNCTNPIMRRCTRARQSWLLRELSMEMLRRGNRTESVRLAGEAMGIYFSLGSIANFARSLIRGISFKAL
jgi:hypothetical protein